MNKRKNDYNDIIRKHLIREDEHGFLPVSTEDFIRMRREIRRKATRDLAASAFRAYMAVIGLPTTGETNRGSIRKLAALAISSKKIAKVRLDGVRRLDKLALSVKNNRAKAATHNHTNGHIVHKEIAISLGES